MSTPYVAYSYADGSANTLRPTKITYPNGREVDYNYGATDSPSDLLSRIYQIKDGTDVLAQYGYVGARVIVQSEYPEPDVSYNLMYEGTAEDPLAGCVDSLNRIIQAPWLRDDAPIAGATYEYDRVSNCTQMQPLGYTATNDLQRYQLDALNRLTSLARGETDEAHGAERWNLDAVGNWRQYSVLNATDPTKNLLQERFDNPANELTAINNFYGAGWAQTAYDSAGNITTLPQPNSTSDEYSATFDAWNRLVLLEDDDAAIESYAYDAKMRRVSQAALGITRHAYFTLGWRDIEQRLDSATTADRQFIWGQRYIDDLILRDSDDRHYCLQDANWNTVAITDAVGDVQQRFRYSAYGQLTRLNTDGSITIGLDDVLWETLYAGYRYDHTTGFYCVRYRYLHALLGEWISRDPLGYTATSLYNYAFSNPIVLIDATGLDATSSGNWYSEGTCCTPDGQKTAFNTVTHCCENGAVVRKTFIYVINRTNAWNGLNLSNPMDNGHIDIGIPGMGMVGYYGAENGIGLNDVGIARTGVLNMTQTDWMDGPTQRPQYVTGESYDLGGGAGTVSNDKSIVCRLWVCPAQITQMKKQISKIQRDPGVFNIAGNNCTSAACNILGSGGVPLNNIVPSFAWPSLLLQTLIQDQGASCQLAHTSVDFATGGISLSNSEPLLGGPPMTGTTNDILHSIKSGKF